MTNQEAIIEGVIKWLDGSREAVLLSIQRGAERAAIQIGETVGFAAGQKIEAFLRDNAAEINTAFAAQMVATALSANNPVGKASVTDIPNAAPETKGEVVG